MISKTSTGVIYPSIALNQMLQYQRDANGYMKDLRSINLDHSFSEALTQRANEVVQKGQEMVASVVETTSWYEPPKSGNVDTWA